MNSLLLAALAFASLTSAPPSQPISEAAIRKIVADQEVAWNAGDGNGYSKDVSPDISFTNIFGMVLYGRSAFETRHREILSTFYRGTTKKQTVRRIRFVTPDVAIVDIDNEVRGVKSLPPGLPVPPDGVIKTQLLEVFVRRDAGWQVEAYHNVDVKTAAPGRDPAARSTRKRKQQARNR